MRRLLLLALIFVAPALFAAADPASIPPAVKAPTDKSEYRRLVLDNGIRVLLCSDPTFNLSSAALAIDVGSLDDPTGRPGLAHFLEHMLFLGTTKYPGESDYAGFIKTNGGTHNGFTGGATTVYPFEVRHEAFAGALDRFSQFFIAPLLTPEFTEREINAVNNEAMRYNDDDNRRIHRVQQEVCRPGTPQQRFGTGNRETLTGVTPQELRAFFEGRYVPGRMALVLCSTHSLDQLESWARQYFASIPQRTPAPLDRPRDFLPQTAAPSLLRIAPLKELRLLDLKFVTDSSLPRWDGKAASLVGKLVGYEGEGSLLAALKDAGLATALSAGADSSVPGYDTFHVRIELTPDGAAQFDRVLAAFFAQIDLLRRSPFPEASFRESAQLARLDETWRDPGEGFMRAAELAENALRHPLEIAERIPYLWLAPDEEGYRALLGCLNPQNMLATFVAPGVTTDREERYYKVQYSFGPDGMPSADALAHPPALDALRLPAPNPFLPGAVAPLPLAPVLLVDEPGLSLHHLQDTEFGRPRATYVVRLRPAHEIVSAQDWVLARFYERCVLEAANRVAYDAQEAGVEFELTVGADGIELLVSGFNGSAEACLSYLAGNLKSFELDATRFAALKDKFVRELESFDRSEAYQQARARRTAIQKLGSHLPYETAPLAREVTLAAVREFGASLLATGRVEALAYGNINAPDTVRTARALVAALGTTPGTGLVAARQRCLAQPAGTTVTDAAPIRGSNSCVWREYEYPDDTPEQRAAALLIGTFLDEPFFTDLRTTQQLGYIVAARDQVDRHTLLQFFLVQSSDYPPAELAKRIAAFESGIGRQWSELSPEDFATLVAGVRTQLEIKDKSDRERAERLFDLAYNLDADWGRREATLAALDRLTPARVGEILAALLDPKTAKVREILLSGEAHKDTALPAPTFTDRDAWKRQQRYR